MANLRDLREKASLLQIAWERTTTKEQLQQLIAAREMDVEERQNASAPGAQSSLSDSDFAPLILPSGPVMIDSVEEDDPPESAVSTNGEIAHLGESFSPLPPFNTSHDDEAIPREGDPRGFDFDRLMRVNQGDVWQDCRNQAKIYMQICVWFAAIESEVLSAEAKLDLVEGSLFCKLKTDTKYSDERTKMEVQSHSDYQSALAILNAWKYKERILKSAMKSAEHRERMLVQLSSKGTKEFEQQCRMDRVTH